jgi:hypothetical protein
MSQAPIVPRVTTECQRQHSRQRSTTSCPMTSCCCTCNIPAPQHINQHVAAIAPLIPVTLGSQPLHIRSLLVPGIQDPSNLTSALHHTQCRATVYSCSRCPQAGKFSIYVGLAHARASGRGTGKGEEKGLGFWAPKAPRTPALV